MGQSNNEPDLLDPLLTLQEVAGIMRCSERTIRRFVQTGRLRAVQAGRRYMFTRHEVTQFIQRSAAGQSVKNVCA